MKTKEAKMKAGSNVFDVLPNAIGRVVATCLKVQARKAIFYVSPKLTIKATRRLTGRNRAELIVTIGRPNYEERKFIKLCAKAKEQFPVKKIQFKW